MVVPFNLVNVTYLQIGCLFQVQNVHEFYLNDYTSLQMCFVRIASGFVQTYALVPVVH